MNKHKDEEKKRIEDIISRMSTATPTAMPTPMPMPTATAVAGPGPVATPWVPTATPTAVAGPGPVATPEASEIPANIQATLNRMSSGDQRRIPPGDQQDQPGFLGQVWKKFLSARTAQTEQVKSIRRGVLGRIAQPFTTPFSTPLQKEPTSVYERGVRPMAAVAEVVPSLIERRTEFPGQAAARRAFGLSPIEEQQATGRMSRELLGQFVRQPFDRAGTQQIVKDLAGLQESRPFTEQLLMALIDPLAIAPSVVSSLRAAQASRKLGHELLSGGKGRGFAPAAARPGARETPTGSGQRYTPQSGDVVTEFDQHVDNLSQQLTRREAEIDNFPKLGSAPSWGRGHTTQELVRFADANNLDWRQSSADWDLLDPNEINAFKKGKYKQEGDVSLRRLRTKRAEDSRELIAARYSAKEGTLVGMSSALTPEQRSLFYTDKFNKARRTAERMMRSRDPKTYKEGEKLYREAIEPSVEYLRYALKERGWSGISIEPNWGYFAEELEPSFRISVRTTDTERLIADMIEIGDIDFKQTSIIIHEPTPETILRFVRGAGNAPDYAIEPALTVRTRSKISGKQWSEIKRLMKAIGLPGMSSHADGQGFDIINMVKYAGDVDADEAAADVLFRIFGDKIEAFTGRMKENAHLRRLGAKGTANKRKVWHFGNKEEWEEYVAKNTGHPKHSYNYYRDYFRRKFGQEASETAGQTAEELGASRFREWELHQAAKATSRASDTAAGAGGGIPSPVPLAQLQERITVALKIRNADERDLALRELERLVEDPLDAVVLSITRQVRNAAPVSPQDVAKARSAVKSQRVARSSAELRRGRATEAFPRAQAAQAGELPDPKFTPPTVSLDQIELLKARIRDDWETGRLQYYTAQNTNIALQRLLGGNVPTKSELKLLENVFGSNLIDAYVQRTKTFRGEAVGFLVDTLTIPKSIRSSFDISFPFRQGFLLGARNPVDFTRAFKDMFRAFSPTKAREINEELFERARRLGLIERGPGQTELFMPDVEGAAGVAAELMQRDEAYLSRYVEKMPGVRLSQRAFNTFGNKLKVDVAEKAIKNWTKEGVDITPDRLDSLNRFLNVYTGRGSLGRRLEPMGDVLNIMFWSPRLFASRLQAPLLLKDPYVRKMAAQNLASSFGLGVTILGIVKYSGVGDVELDPRSSDFGQIRIGRARINFWAGFQQIARYMAQIAVNQTKDKDTGDIIDGDKYPFNNRVKRIIRFSRSKIAPGFPALIANELFGKSFLGEDLSERPDKGRAPGPIEEVLEAFGLDSLREWEAIQQVTPLVAIEIIDAIEELGWAPGLAFGAMPVVGIGTQIFNQPREEEFYRPTTGFGKPRARPVRMTTPNKDEEKKRIEDIISRMSTATPTPSR
jgi:hypothetical protein